MPSNTPTPAQNLIIDFSSLVERFLQDEDIWYGNKDESLNPYWDRMLQNSWAIKKREYGASNQLMGEEYKRQQLFCFQRRLGKTQGI